MTKRIAYKPKWQAAEARAQRASEKVSFLQGELDRIRGVLADFAEVEVLPAMKVMHENTKDGTDIPLNPLSFEAFHAFLLAHQRWVSDEEERSLMGGFVRLAYKAKKVICSRYA